MFSVWGSKYATVEAMVERVGALRAFNREHGPSDDRVCEINALTEKIGEVTEARRKAAERPYVVLYRKYKPNGDCYKGRRTFRTEAERSRWITNADDDIAITGF